MLPQDYNSIKIISECPICRQKHFPSDINIVEERENGHLLHIQCKHCRGYLAVLVTFTEQGLNMVGVLTDLSSEEMKEHLRREPLTADDLIDNHKLIYGQNFPEFIIKEKL